MFNYFVLLVIQEESNDKDHPDWIEVLSFSGGHPQPGTSGTTGGTERIGGREHRAGPGQVVIVKQVDKLSPLLSQACVSGKSFPAVTIEVARTDGKPGYIRYTFQNVVIRSVNPGSGGSLPTENISLNYGSVSVAYTSQNDGGSKPKPKGAHTWSPSK